VAVVARSVEAKVEEEIEDAEAVDAVDPLEGAAESENAGPDATIEGDDASE
jgi:hypothetical protein